ncbi:MAG: heavy-metal-associated domain-containing protein [Dongiaceae bacterium]
MKSFFTAIILVMALTNPVFAAPAAGMENGQTVHISVNGLVCDFCARSLEKVFAKQESVASVTVDLGAKLITLDLKKDKKISDETITKLVNDAGYSVEKIHRVERE